MKNVHPFRYLSYHHLIGEAVGLDKPPFVESEVAISAAVHCRCPYPTPIRPVLIDLCPKTLFHIHTSPLENIKPRRIYPACVAEAHTGIRRGRLRIAQPYDVSK